MIHTSRRTTALFFTATALLVTAGCGNGDVGRVAGKVTLGGQPVTEGVVLFENTQLGVSVNAPIQSDGTYVAKTYDRKGLPPGTYQVAVRPVTFGDGETPLAVDPAGQEAPPASPIPEKYQNVNTSGLTVTVEAGDNEPLDFELQP